MLFEEIWNLGAGGNMNEWMIVYLYTAHITYRLMVVYNSVEWDRTSACKGAPGCRYQFIFDLTHPPNPRRSAFKNNVISLISCMCKQNAHVLEWRNNQAAYSNWIKAGVFSKKELIYNRRCCSLFCYLFWRHSSSSCHAIWFSLAVRRSFFKRIGDC